MQNTMKTIKYAIYTALLILPFTLPAQPAFHTGEELILRVSYRAKLVPNTEVAEVTLRVSDTTINGRKVYRIHGNGRTLPSFRWFYNLNDSYDSYVDCQSGRPVLSTSSLREGSYRASSRFTYDWDNRKVTTVKQRKEDPPVTRTLDLQAKSYDGVSLFYDLRSTDISSLKRGDSQVIALLLDDTVRHISYRFLGREKKKVRGVGTFRTLKFSCQMATSTGMSFDDGDEFFIWISDDSNKIPVYFESPIKVGSVRAYIKSYKGLMHPLESLVDK